MVLTSQQEEAKKIDFGVGIAYGYVKCSSWITDFSNKEI